MFMNPEIILWAYLVKAFQTLLVEGADNVKATGVFDLKTEEGAKRWKDLQNRVVEHVRVIKIIMIIIIIIN